MIDTHCHLNYDYTPKTIDDLVREARDAGVEILITIGTELTTLEEIRLISEKYSNVYHTVGVHPHDAATITDESLATLEQAALHPKCVAIGEIGLDYHYDHSPRDIQNIRLKDQLAIALKLKLPVVIHSRDAEPDLRRALEEYASQIQEPRAPGIIHCFSGTREFGEACVKMGFYISFSGILTFKNAEALREAAKIFPMDRILLETDSPYLAPIPYRGKKCEPAMVRLTAQKLAEIRNISLAETDRITTDNARRIFGIAVS